MSLPTILHKIIQQKHDEIKEGHTALSLANAKAQAGDCPPTRGFAKQLVNQVASGQIGIIAELKRASPSKGVIRKNFDPESIAISYQNGGATCLSILTDQLFFQGHCNHLKQARAAVTLPLLRKDFMIDPWQVYESRIIGADCILLIASALSDIQLADFNGLAQELGMSVLLEVHSEGELERALPLKNALLGVNNRNLHTFEVSLNNTFTLLPLIPDDRLVITESGIHTQDDVNKMLNKKVKAFLIGEAFMRHDNPGEALNNILRDCSLS
ncbi:MAG: indole-3-glycerol phosphate synthase TrpC [Endozoicomonas sp. (ex Botrylloides leachii)]|nr:indole-3-glycerol phosphate synthase TrpC [Endozoicomonas sp. (ex Botrylloides leachii)]